MHKVEYNASAASNQKRRMAFFLALSHPLSVPLRRQEGKVGVRLQNVLVEPVVRLAVRKEEPRTGEAERLKGTKWRSGME